MQSSVASTAGHLPRFVTEEELMSSGHELPEGYTCPLCCLPIAVPVEKHSKLEPCCMKTLCNGCVLASAKRGMGNMCAFCRTPTPDNDQARLTLVRKRVDAKDPVATKSLANAYFYGNHGLQQDHPRAIELWTEAALLGGDLFAHYKLGCIYYIGEGVEQNKGKAIRYFQHAAIHGHPESRFMLGLHEYENGNHELAVQHSVISTKMGYEDSLNGIKAMFMKGHATKAQYAAALKDYQTALEETKSPQREEAETYFDETLHLDRSFYPNEGPRPSNPLSSDSKYESGHRVASLLPGATGERAVGPTAVSWGDREHQGRVSGRGYWVGPSRVSLRAPRRDGDAPRQRPASSVCCPHGQGWRPGVVESEMRLIVASGRLRPPPASPVSPSPLPTDPHRSPRLPRRATRHRAEGSAFVRGDRLCPARVLSPPRLLSVRAPSSAGRPSARGGLPDGGATFDRAREEGVQQNVARGIRHWQQAAIQGHPDSRFMLGVHEYENGNHELAVQHWMITAKMGGEDSLNNIKAMFWRDMSQKRNMPRVGGVVHSLMTSFEKCLVAARDVMCQPLPPPARPPGVGGFTPLQSSRPALHSDPTTPRNNTTVNRVTERYQTGR
ncbi:hypothetical protein THAOC_32536, partial [Thalassiosira oceanica]